MRNFSEGTPITLLPEPLLFTWALPLKANVGSSLGRDAALPPSAVGWSRHVHPDGRAHYSGGASSRQPLRCARPSCHRLLVRERLLQAAPMLWLRAARRNTPAANCPAACAHACHPLVLAIRHKSGWIPLARRARDPTQDDVVNDEIIMTAGSRTAS